MFSQVLQGLLFALFATSAAAQITAVPPAFYEPGPTVKAEVAPTLLTSDAAPKHVITLAAPSAAEKSSLKRDANRVIPNAKSAAQGNKGRPRQIGFARSLPDGERPLYLAGLPWQSSAEGGLAARIEIKSPGAAAIRLRLAMSATDPDVTLRFVGSDRRQQVFGPYPANKIAESMRYWSPVLEGDTATLELYLPPGVSPSSVQLALPQLSHLVAAGAALEQVEPIEDIGTSAYCEVDVACVTPQSAALLNQAKSVAKMLFTEEGSTFLCTGTMLNDAQESFTPYFFTASHCIDSQEAASTLNTYWFFDALTCGSTTVPPYALVVGGAMLLGRSTDYDWALVRLNGRPAPGTYFSAWRAELTPQSAIVNMLHHPEGDLKKFSQGVTQPYVTFSNRSSFISIRYTLGLSEPGSSGSGLITFSDTSGYYELRGGLLGRDPTVTCRRPASGSAYYSRLDLALPLLKQHLIPNDTVNPTKLGVVVEFYNASLNHYFISADPAEINDLDTGVHPGWARTGLRFLVYTDAAVAPADANPVCRFYLLPQFGNSHFYSADPNECVQTAAKFVGRWFYESPAVFYIQLPEKTTGTCPANTHPIYRFFNPPAINHRYTAEVDVRDCLIRGAPDPDGVDPTCRAPGSGWIQEGYGRPPDEVIMCSPNG